MKRFILFFVAAFALLVSSCTESENQQVVTPQSDRVCFVDRDAFNAYLDSQSSGSMAQTFESDQNPTSIMGQFKAYTAIGKLLNANLEFQIGDTIYKYCESGMGVFEIKASDYDKLKYYYNKDGELIANIKDFKESSPFRYQIVSGLVFDYTGEPVIEVLQTVAPIPTRMSLDGLTKVQASFWKSSGLFNSSCGVKVEAWSRDNTMQDFQEANTDLTLEWNIQVKAERTQPTFRSSRGGLSNKGNVIEQTIFSTSSYEKFTLWTNSSIVGRAKCWDGSWIKAEVTK